MSPIHFNIVPEWFAPAKFHPTAIDHDHLGSSRKWPTLSPPRDVSGARLDLATTHIRFAECLHKKGDLDAAREQLDLAEALFRDMGMDWWTEQAAGLRGRIDSGAEFVWFAPYVDGPATS